MIARFLPLLLMVTGCAHSNFTPTAFAPPVGTIPPQDLKACSATEALSQACRILDLCSRARGV